MYYFGKGSIIGGLKVVTGSDRKHMANRRELKCGKSCKMTLIKQSDKECPGFAIRGYRRTAPQPCLAWNWAERNTIIKRTNPDEFDGELFIDIAAERRRHMLSNHGRNHAGSPTAWLRLTAAGQRPGDPAATRHVSWAMGPARRDADTHEPLMDVDDVATSLDVFGSSQENSMP
ncbi:Protein of unknown function [Pyronema omphalodes CBS 100304]|uniref:Uncharacterized protein n=1 Tax=Pyronema omphalodes (strain CBS 100304) TaxID=1076935 RepID=U4LGP6_PYROM|nr:Protein of unknown function [Pyronema omphalodes CBS 100304]